MRKLAKITSLIQTMIFETTDILIDGPIYQYPVEKTSQIVDIEFTFPDGTIVESKAEVLNKIYKQDQYKNYKCELFIDYINMGDEVSKDLYIIMRIPKFKCIYKLLKDENDYAKIQIRDNHTNGRS